MSRRTKVTDTTTTEPQAHAKRVWVHPDLNRILKGPDHKLATSSAVDYWIECQVRRAGTGEASESTELTPEALAHQ
jgi:hypothetical protein